MNPNETTPEVTYVDPERPEMLASEALYGFVGWLTSREEPVTFSEKHDAAPAADLVAQFCITNKLREPRENWTKNLTHPKENADEDA